MKTEKRSLLDRIFKRPTKEIVYTVEDYVNGRVPIYVTDFGENIYASDVVQQAVYSIVSELKKLDPVHVRMSKSGVRDYIAVDGNVQNVLDNPNPLMTTTDFIEKISWMLLLNSKS